MMRIVFIGTVDFSLKALQKLIDMEANVVAVCTKESSACNSDFTDLSPLCRKHNIPFSYVDNINSSENIRWVKGFNPDVIFCFGWSSLLKRELLTVPPMGVIGFHPAHLPYNRGRHPLIWALALGLKHSAVTFFFMAEGADDGDILAQKIFDITYQDDANTIYHKMTQVALLQIEAFLPSLETNTYKRIKQNHQLANSWRKRNKKDGRIDFRMSSYAIYNLVRSLVKPYVGAHIEYRNEDITIWKVEEVECLHKNIEYGKVLETVNNTLVIKCYDNAIRILEHEFTELPEVGEYL